MDIMGNENWVLVLYVEMHWKSELVDIITMEWIENRPL